MKKVIYTFLLFCIFTNTNANNKETFNQSGNKDNTVTLTQIGQGKTKDDAKYNALRNALERAFGTFISSNTKILNDELIKDEIVSVSSGNIQKFEILSETQMPDGSYTSVVKATVSIGKLITFCESKGIAVKFEGGAFAANIKLEEMNKKNETAVMRNLFKVLDEISSNGVFDYKIDVSEPKKDNSFYGSGWIVDFSVTATANKNIENIGEITMNTVKNICLSPQDVSTYSKQNLKMYKININGIDYYFRDSFSVIYLRTIFEKRIPLASLNFSVSDGIDTYGALSMVSNKRTKDSDYSKLILDNPKLPRLNRESISSPIVAKKYFVRYTYLGRSASTHTAAKGSIPDFIASVDNSNFQEINDSFCQYDSRLDTPDLTLLPSVEILYHFRHTYSMNQLEKINEFKVQPIMR